MDPGAAADAVETGEEDAIMAALRAYNREVSGTVDAGRARRRWGRVGHARGRQRVRECGRERGAEAARSCWGRVGVRAWGAGV